MKKNIILILYFINTIIKSQGCSDAGFCTMGAMRPNQKYLKDVSIKLRSIEYTSYWGITDFHLKNDPRKIYDYFSSQLIDANIGITNKTTFQIKLPLNTTFGNLTTKTGLSDLTLSISEHLFSKRNLSVNGTIGTKIPLQKPNLKNNEGKPLPMYYQPTLGTYDFITGISLSSSKWMIATGYQMPLNSNANEFVWAPWNSTSDSAIANIYPRANKLKRGSDLMFRIERNFRFSKWNAYIGFLPIYRLNKDQFLNPKTNAYESINGSNGLAATVLVGGSYKFSYHSSLKLVTGVRVVKRGSNPDGLSRIAVTSISYEFAF